MRKRNRRRAKINRPLKNPRLKKRKRPKRHLLLLVNLIVFIVYVFIDLNDFYLVKRSANQSKGKSTKELLKMLDNLVAQGRAHDRKASGKISDSFDPDALMRNQYELLAKTGVNKNRIRSAFKGCLDTGLVV